MQGLKLLPAAAALAAAAPAPAAGPRTYLASIEGIAIAANEYVDGFTIDTWGVEIVAVCHLPPGWEIRAGKQASPDGVIAGEASHGVTFLDRPRLGALRRLVLVRLYPPIQRRRTGDQPATFAGHARIGRYGVIERRRQVALTWRNLRLTPASRCPPPR
jgi:hypothetical protein